MASRLASSLERLDGHLADRSRDVRRRERPPIEPLRGHEQPRARHDVPVAGAARKRVEHDVRAAPRAGRQRCPGRHQLDQPGELLLAVLEACPDEPEAGVDAAQCGGDQSLGPATVDKEHDPAVAGDRRLDGPQRPAERRRLPAPRRADRAAGQGLERQDRRRFAAQHPGRRPIRKREALLVRPDGRLAEDEPDPPSRRPAEVAAAVAAERAPGGRAGHSHDRGRRAVAEAPEVRPEPGLDRAEGAALESLDESPHESDPVLEGEPRVPLAPLAASRRAHPPALDPERPDPPGEAVEAARREQRVEEPEAQRSLDGSGPEVALNAFEDRLQADELAGRVEVEQAVDERLAPLHDGEPVAEPVPGDIGVVGEAARPRVIVLVERRRSLLGPAPLAAADGAAEVLAGGRGLGTGSIVVGRGAGPDELVGREHPLAGRAAGREEVADRDLQARLAARGGGHRLERRVEVAQVRRAEHQLGKESRQRARFEADRRSLAGDRRVGNPAAPTVEIEDDVTG